MKKRAPDKTQGSSRGRTDLPGQNPKADDSPEHDEHRDEARRNAYDPEVAESLKGPGKSKKNK